jgi:hypothetical protein
MQPLEEPRVQLGSLVSGGLPSRWDRPIGWLWLHALFVFPFCATTLYFLVDERLNPPETDSWSREVAIRVVLWSVLPLIGTAFVGVVQRTRPLKIALMALLSGIWGYAFPFATLIVMAVVGLYEGS